MCGEDLLLVLPSTVAMRSGHDLVDAAGSVDVGLGIDVFSEAGGHRLGSGERGILPIPFGDGDPLWIEAWRAWVRSRSDRERAAREAGQMLERRDLAADRLVFRVCRVRAESGGSQLWHSEAGSRLTGGGRIALQHLIDARAVFEVPRAHVNDLWVVRADRPVLFAAE